jgi:effector-binding domain-containing protein
MIEAPEIANSQEEAAAVIHLQCPREKIQAEVGPAVMEIVAALKSQGQSPTGPMFMHHLKTSKSQFDVEVGFPISSSASLRESGRVKPSRLPAARVARTIYHGPYEGLFSAWEAFGKQLVSDGLVSQDALSPIKTLWERYLVGPETSSDQSRWRTELNLPLSQTANRIDK